MSKVNMQEETCEASIAYILKQYGSLSLVNLHERMSYHNMVASGSSLSKALMSLEASKKIRISIALVAEATQADPVVVKIVSEAFPDDEAPAIEVELGRGGRPKLLSSMSYVLKSFGPMHPEAINQKIIDLDLATNSKKPVDYIRFALSKNKDLFEKVPGQRGMWRAKEAAVPVISLPVVNELQAALENAEALFDEAEAEDLVFFVENTLEEHRLESNIDPEQVCAITEIPLECYMALELGTASPTPEAALSLANLYEVPISALFPGSEGSEQRPKGDGIDEVLHEVLPSILKDKRKRPNELAVHLSNEGRISTNLDVLPQIITMFLQKHPELFERDKNYRWFTKEMS